MDRKREKIIVDKLNSKGPELYDGMDAVTPTFMAVFKKHGVITNVQHRSIMSKQDPEQLLGALLEHIRLDAIPRYAAFLDALRETGQIKVIRDILGEEIMPEEASESMGEDLPDAPTSMLGAFAPS